jgi:two-component system, cell cycle response regulator
MPNSEMKILLVEDNPGDACLFREVLTEISELRFEIIHRATLAEALEFLAKSTADVALLDLGLSDAQGLEVVRQIHLAAPHMPLVVLTALNDEALAVQSLQEGAQDYLVKAEADSGSLWRALRYAMERQRVQLEALSLSLIDDLTGLSNRKGFLNLAHHYARLAYRTGKPFLIAFIDLDGLKQINDNFGHQEGNRALVEAANVLRDSFRQSDILARLGGDEFAVLIAEAVKGSIATVIDRVQEKLRSRNTDPTRRYQLSLSIGIVASDPAKPPDLEQLLHQADALMYRHKQERRLSREAGPDTERVRTEDQIR